MSGFIQNVPAANPSHSVGSGTNAQAITPTAIGNTLISLYGVVGTVTPVAPTDSSGQTWALAIFENGSGETVACAFLLSCNATAARTITWATQTNASTQALIEVNGITAIGGTAVTATAATTTVTSPNYTPSQANEFVLALISLAGTNANDQVTNTTAAFQTIGSCTDNASHSCVGIEQNGATFNSFEANARIVTSAATLTSTWTYLSNAAVCVVLGFKYTPAAGGGVQSKLPLTGVGALAPLAWIIRRRQRRAKELRSWARDEKSGLILPTYKKAA